MAQSSVGTPSTQAADEQRWPPFQYYVKVTLAVLLTLLGAHLIYRARSILVLIFLGMFLAVGAGTGHRAVGTARRRRGWCVLGFGVIVTGLVGAIVALPVAAAGSVVLRNTGRGRQLSPDPAGDQPDRTATNPVASSAQWCVTAGQSG